MFLPFSDGRGHKRNKSDEATLVQIDIDHPDLCIQLPRTDNGRDDSGDSGATCTPPVSAGDNIIPVTPLVVGQVWSKDDLFYTPHKDNPFIAKFPDATAKLVGSIRDNWGNWFDLPTPSSALTPPCTPMTPDECGHVRPLRRSHTRSHSLPGSPTLPREDGEYFQFNTVGAGNCCGARRTFSAITSIRKLEEELQMVVDESLSLDASFDALSDGGSSSDSALGWDMIMRDLQTPRFARCRQYPGRKFSVEASMLNSSVERCRSRPEQIARYIESRLCADPFLRRSYCGPPYDEDYGPKSYSSSESCMSLDESSSLLSPTSTFSAESESDFWHSRTQIELMEYRRRSRERFQELVKRWEAKQQSTDGKPRSGNLASALATDCAQTSTLSAMQRHQLVGESLRYSPREWRQSGPAENSDLYVERRFEELRRKWEKSQLTPEGCHRRVTGAALPKSVSSSLLTRSAKKPS